jgi:hypothetical protein
MYIVTIPYYPSIQSLITICLMVIVMLYYVRMLICYTNAMIVAHSCTHALTHAKHLCIGTAVISLMAGGIA